MIYARFWPATKPIRGRIYLSFALVAAAPVLSTAAIWLFKIAVDQVLVPHDYRLFPQVAAAYLGIVVLQGVVRFADQYVSTGASERFVLDLRSRLFSHLHRLSPGFFDNHPLGDLLSRLTNDISAIEDLLITGMAQALTYLLQIVFYTAALFYLDWRLAAAALAASPGFLLATRYFSRRIKSASGEKRRRTGALTAVAEESFGNVAVVRAYQLAAAECTRFREQSLAAYAAQMTATRLQALFSPLTDLFEALGILLVVGLAVEELASGRISIGGLLTFIAYVTQLYSPVQGFGQLSNQLYAATAGAERVIELLDESPTVRDPVHPHPLPKPVGAVSFRGVVFGYPRRAGPAISGIDVEIHPGEKVAIVGPSGAGKSTIAKLLLRFYDPDSGAIALDGVDLRELDLSDLYRNVATVLQETLVFDGTIGENIRWGNPEATDEQVVGAAVAADAHEFVQALPDGYRTRVGQRGRMLSGGQRQRLAIARAMIRDAPVLLLDEPTTGLDAQTAHRVLAPLRRLMAGRTTIIISHNLLTVTDVDRILYLEQGRIVAIGGHSQLLHTCPGYARLYSLQRQSSQQSTVGDSPHPSPTHDVGSDERFQPVK